MCKTQWLLAVVALHVGMAHSWDIAVGVGDQLIFYNNGYKTDTVRLKHQQLGALAYDRVHNTMLYVDKQDNNDTICGYDISFKKKDCYIKRNGRNIHSLAYEPTTEILFFTDIHERSINWISLKRGSNNNIYGNLLIKMEDRIPTDIIVDSCEGDIYWINTNVTKSHYKETMETARFDGSKRRKFSTTRYDLFTHFPDLSFTMDTQNRAIYYFDDCVYPCSTIFLNVFYLNGKPSEKVYSNSMHVPKELTVSNDNLYWMSRYEEKITLWTLPKNSRDYEEFPKEISTFYTQSTLGIAANYEIDDQFRKIQDCDSLSSLKPTIRVAPANTGERCNVSACENYCMRGDCSVNNQGFPKCSCDSGYTGQRCEVPACHGFCLNDGHCSLNENSKPVCQCKGDHSGDRCEVSDCQNYCIQGDCRLNDEGLPTCSCNAGYSGERCEVSACHGYCLNDGECSINEEDEPVCQCVGTYDGSRCEVDINNNFTFTNSSTSYLALKNLTLADLLLNWRKPSAKISVTVEV